MAMPRNIEQFGEIRGEGMEIENLIGRFFENGFIGNPQGCRAPRIEIEESSEAYIIKAELPDMSKEDIKISVEKNLLTINAEKKVEETKNKVIYSERKLRGFRRVFSLPAEIENVDAEYKDGLLKMTINKTQKSEKREIMIK